MGLILKGKEIILRAIEPEDLEFIYNCENNSEIWNISNTLAPYSKYTLKQYIENSHHDIYTNKQLRLIIALANNPKELVGAIDLFDFDPFHMRAGVGILINNEIDRKKGYAFESLKLLKNYCFIHLQLHQLYCNISIANTNSISLFEKIGFLKCGVKKEWIKTANGWEDELLYQIINPEFFVN